MGEGSEPGPVAGVKKPVFADVQARLAQVLKEQAARRKAERLNPGSHLGLPASTWRALQVNQLLDRIASGNSSVTFGAGASQQFKDTHLAFLRELAQTKAGYQLLSDLDAASFKTTIGPTAMGGTNETWVGEGARVNADGTPGPGSDAAISMNPALTTFKQPGETEKPWMTERPKYGFYHELVHAWTAVQGTTATGTHQGFRNAEWQAVGFGSDASSEVSENVIRQQMGKELRPGVGGKVFVP